jgi:S-disulfanyl-L-cysteine oxidoreductase SoxD
MREGARRLPNSTERRDLCPARAGTPSTRSFAHYASRVTRRGCSRWLLAATASLLLGAPTAAAQDSTRTTRSGVYTEAQAERGKDAYVMFCKSCHTPASHTGATFAGFWDGHPLSDLFGFVSTRMPKNDPGTLSPEEYADIVAYLLQMNAMPAGPADLRPDSAALAAIRIALPPATAAPARAAPAKPAPARTTPANPTRPPAPPTPRRRDR